MSNTCLEEGQGLKAQYTVLFVLIFLERERVDLKIENNIVDCFSFRKRCCTVIWIVYKSRLYW